MKILYISNYRENSGWSQAARGYILALDAVGIDVVPRPIHFTKNIGEYPTRIKELEQKSDKNCDIVIQHTLPHLFHYSSKFEKNIGLYVTETSHFRNTNWPQHINMMDEGWVACVDSLNHSYASNVITPLEVVPHAFDISKYNKRYDKLDIPDLRNKFVFYFIGEFSRRKNLTALLKAYHLEFHPSEPVNLLIKSSVPGMSEHQARGHLVNYCRNIKEQLNIYKNKEDYLNEVIITQYLSDEQIMQVHSTCDCLVAPSFGEGWGLSTFDSMAMGNTPICSNIGGPKDYMAIPIELENGLGEKTTLYDQGGWLIPTVREPVFGMTPWAQTPNLYLGNEDWWNIDIYELRKAMRTAFENKAERNRRGQLGRKRALDFSYEKIGELMECILHGENLDKPITHSIPTCGIPIKDKKNISGLVGDVNEKRTSD